MKNRLSKKVRPRELRRLTEDEVQSVVIRVAVARELPIGHGPIVAYLVREPADLRAAVEALQRDALELWQDVPLRSILRTLVFVPQDGKWGDGDQVRGYLRNRLFYADGDPLVDWIVVDPEWAWEEDDCGWTPEMGCKPEPHAYALDAAVLRAVAEVTRNPMHEGPECDLHGCCPPLIPLWFGGWPGSKVPGSDHIDGIEYWEVPR